MKKQIIGIVLVCVMVIGISASASAATLTLDEETKEEYYLEYIEIAKEVSKEAELDISVLPIDEFQEEDWRTPQEFRNLITEVAYWHLTCTDSGDDALTQSTASATKSTTVTADGRSYTLSITGSFKTDLNTSVGQQRFSGINSITSKLTGSTGTWTQTGYESQSMDAARTYGITVSGKLTIAGAVFSNKLAYVEFYCNGQGVVS